MGLKASELGDLQLMVLRALWQLSEGTVYEVLGAIQRQPAPAYTTVLTALRSLEKRGLVSHHNAPGDRQHRYRALIDKAAVERSILCDVILRLFDGDTERLALRLLEIEQGLSTGDFPDAPVPTPPSLNGNESEEEPVLRNGIASQACPNGTPLPEATEENPIMVSGADLYKIDTAQTRKEVIAALRKEPSPLHGDMAPHRAERRIAPAASASDAPVHPPADAASIAIEPALPDPAPEMPQMDAQYRGRLREMRKRITRVLHGVGG